MTLTEQIASVRREIAMRERVYPNWVASKKMTQAKADHELAAMRAVLDTLTVCAAEQPSSVWRHRVRGTMYHIIGEVRVQCPTDKPLRDDETPLLYRDVNSGKWGARRADEFHDGRFEEMP